MNAPGGRQPVVVQPLPSRLEIHATRDQLKIEFLGRSRWYHWMLGVIAVLWSGLFVVIFGVAAAAVIVMVYVTGEVPVEGSPLAVLLCGPAVLLVLVAWPMLGVWTSLRLFTAMLIRRETISVNDTDWIVERDLGLWRSRQRFAVEAIARVELVPVRRARPFQVPPVLLEQPGAVAMRAGRRRVGLAHTATEVEARLILAALALRFPDKIVPEATPPPEPVPAGRVPWQVERQGGALVVTLPVRANWRQRLAVLWGVLFNLVWVGGMGALTFQGVTTSQAPLSFAALMVVMIGAGLGTGLWSAREAFWEFAGREVITVTAQGIMLDAANLWFGRPRVFAAPHIRNVRVAQKLWRVYDQTAGQFRQPGQFGALAFDYGAATWCCGGRLTPAEAAALCGLICEQFPAYGRAV